MNNLKIFSVLLLLILHSTLKSQSLFSWKPLPNAPINKDGKFEDIYFFNNYGWLVSGNGNVYKTSDNGKTWNEFTIQNNPYLRSVCFLDSLHGWIGNLDPNFNDLLYATSNGGQTWNVVTNLPSTTPPGICGMFVVDSVVYGCGRYSDGAGILKTTDKGISWTHLNMQNLAMGLVDMFFFDPDTGFAVGLDTTAAHAVVLFTSNGGLNWEIKHTSIHSDEWAWKIIFPSRNVGYVSIQSFHNNSNFLKTTDCGKTWVDLPNSGINNFVPSGIGFATESIGWQGPHPGFTNEGYIIETNDGGINWVVNQNAKNVNKFRFINDTLAYACGETVYKYTNESFTSNSDKLELYPVKYFLKQNFPNPFNPITTIVFSIPNEEHVVLSINDINGKLMKVILDQVLSPSEYEIRLNLNEFSSGVYFYRLRSGDFFETKKMLLLK